MITMVADILSLSYCSTGPRNSEIHPRWSCTLGTAHCAEVHDPAMVEGNQHLEKEICITTGHPIGGDACYWPGQSPERGPNVECSVGLAEGTEADRFEGCFMAEHISSEEGKLIPTELTEFCNSSGGFVPILNALKGKTEDLLLFMVPKAQCVATLNRCHQDAGHQGCMIVPCLLLQRMLLVAKIDQPGGSSP